MAQSNSTHVSGGIGFAGLLTIVFITLKIIGYISWSWWWVLSPLWLAPIVIICAFILVFVTGLILNVLFK